MAVSVQFFTTREQEKILENRFKRELIKKQNEIDETVRRTGVVSKYPAHAYVSVPYRVFCVVKSDVYFGTIGSGNKCPVEKTEGGKRYILDRDLIHAVHGFVQKHKTYTVSFDVSGRYMRYNGDEDVFPAILVSHNGEELMVANINKYSINGIS
jgi:hypothetical protein